MGFTTDQIDVMRSHMSDSVLQVALGNTIAVNVAFEVLSQGMAYVNAVFAAVHESAPKRSISLDDADDIGSCTPNKKLRLCAHRVPPAKRGKGRSVIKKLAASAAVV